MVIDFPEDLIRFLDGLPLEDWAEFCGMVRKHDKAEQVSFISYKYPGDYSFFDTKENIIKLILKYRALKNFK